MFINKWRIVDSVNDSIGDTGGVGLCIRLKAEHAQNGEVYKFLQNLPVEKSIAVLLSGSDFHATINDFSIEKIISLFFQPNYYLYNYHPVLFVANKNQYCSDFLQKLIDKSNAHGLHEILVLEVSVSDYPNTSITQFAYHVNDAEEVNYHQVIKNWLTICFANKDTSEIHFLVSSQKDINEIFKKMADQEESLKNTEDYKIANTFYQKQRLIEECKHQLFLKTALANNLQGYLSVQKEERANGLKWYYNEYEILPKWYKKFGHILKVIMGKRSFRSLFNDSVKKYKD